MRPHRNVEVPLGYDEAYSRVLEALDVTLGANISIDDRKGRLIEAGFGLLRSERIRVSFDTLEERRTNVRIEAFYLAGTEIKERSAAVDALADALESGVAP
jgi:hypothetical protein